MRSLISARKNREIAVNCQTDRLNMKHLTLFIAVLTFSFQSINAVSQDTGSDPAVETPGFQTAVFDMNTLNKIFKKAECVAVRFYNVLPEAGASEGTVLAIGIDQNGAELNKGFFVSPYKRADGIFNDRINIKSLTRSKAVEGCNYLVDAKHHSYSASFSRDIIDVLKDVADCNSFIITPQVSPKNGLSMNIAAAKFDNVSAKSLNVDDSCTDPCPLICGPDANYLNR